MLVAGLGMGLLPQRFALFVSPSTPGYPESRRRWAIVALAGLAVLGWVLSGRGPRLGGRIAPLLRQRPAR